MFTTHAPSRYRPTEGKTSSFPGLSVWFCRHVVTLLGGGTGPSQYLYLHRTTKMPKNASIYPCPEWDRTSDLLLKGQKRSTGDTARSFWPSQFYHFLRILFDHVSGNTRWPRRFRRVTFRERVLPVTLCIPYVTVRHIEIQWHIAN